jgi:hypothetical protein
MSSPTRAAVDPEDLVFAHRVTALKLNMEGFTSDTGAIFRSHPEPRTPHVLVDAVLRAVA